MLTYRLQKRHFKTERPPTFPNDVRVVLFLGPPTPFGEGVGGGRTATRAVKATSLWNANTDRVTITSETAFDRVNIHLPYPDHAMLVDVQGASATIHAKCETVEDLAGLVDYVYHVFPATLNVNFYDAPVVHHVGGTIGDVEYTWTIVRTASNIKLTTTADQEQYITDAWHSMTTLFAGGQHRRLVAALHYFHVACRLFDVGPSPWEFMGEVILNLAKVLQALFGQNREDVRAGLRSLGYSDEATDEFIIVMELRDTLDSGHVLLSVMDETQASNLYTFLYGRELRFRELLSRALERTKQGTFKVDERPDLTLDARVRKLFARIAKTNQAAPPRPPSETA